MNKMNIKSTLFALVMLFSMQLSAQNIHDTIHVQAFKYESNTRDTMINFPIVNSSEIERVWMRYAMRCKDGLVSPAISGQTNIGCGEWDYSCNTYITDSSRIDSIKTSIEKYLVYPQPSSDNWYSQDVTHNIYQRNHTILSALSTISESNYILSGNSTSSTELLSSSKYGGKLYLLLNQATLSASGITPGLINSLSLINNSSNVDLKHFKIQLKEVGTSDFTTMTSNDFTGLQEVYFSNINMLSGANQFVFHQDFNWTGGNILVEITAYGLSSTSSLDLAISSMSYPASFYVNDNKFARFFTNNYIDVPNYQGIGGNSARTIEAWIKTPTPNKNIAAWGLDQQGKRFTFRTDATGGLRVEINGGYVIGATNVCDNEWHHVAMVFNGTSLSNVTFYVDGVQESIASINNLAVNTELNANVQISKGFFNRYFNGGMDDIRIWNSALSQNTINFYKDRKVDAQHPNYANLQLNYLFNEASASVLDYSPNGRDGVFQYQEAFGDTYRLDHAFEYEMSYDLPAVTLHQGNYSFVSTPQIENDSIPQLPYIVVENQLTPNPGTLISDITSINYNLWPDSSVLYSPSGTAIQVIPASNTIELINETINYFNRTPSRVELMSFVTPYGINLDLGIDGKAWFFDVTDYLPILQGTKRMTMERGGQWQEDMDLQFFYVYGTPVRDVLDMRQIWKVDSRSFALIQSDSYFEPVTVKLAPATQEAKIRTMITGHGQEGEFIPRNHFLNINNGQQMHNWQVWTECGENPVYPQGGTWIYDRAGWCPGMPTDLKEWEVTPYISNNEFDVDYGITNATGTSNYIVNHQIVSYGSANFTTDARIQSIKSPSNDIANGRYNPVCSQPVIRIQNSGSNAMSSATITYQINNGPVESYQWSGNLAYLEESEVILPVSGAFWSAATTGSNFFKAIITAVNGNSDQYNYNDTLQSTFTLNETQPNNFIIRFRTNNAANESQYQLLDSDNNVLFTRSGMSNATTYNDTFALNQGCYKFKVYDTGDDGIDFWANSDGVGYVQIRSLQNQLLKTFEPDFGDGIHYEFTVTGTADVEGVKADKALHIFPNPSRDQIAVNTTGLKNAEWKIVDLMGKEVKSGKTGGESSQTQVISISDIPSGMYLFLLQDSHENLTQTFVKE